MSTITSTITNSVTLGTSGNYASPLTIATGGAVISTGTAVYGPGGHAWTVDNYGTVSGTSGIGIELNGGGNVTNGSTGNTTATVAGATFGIDINNAGGTVTNYGTVTGTGTSLGNAAVYLAFGGLVKNKGTISAPQAVGFNSGTGTHTGTLLNYGVIKGTNTVAAVAFSDGGSADNSGTISSTSGGGIEFFNHNNTVTNSGSISGVNGVLIDATVSGTSVNTVVNSGNITGSNYGVGFIAASGDKAVGTLINSGTITGGSVAVEFNGGKSIANRVILESGGVFNGIVQGDLSTGATNALELASGTGGTITSAYLALNGTISGAGGTTFEFFNIVQIDSGASWANSGALTNKGTLTDLGTLTNSGTISGNGTFIVNAGTLNNTGSISSKVTLEAGGYLDNTSTGKIAVTGSGVNAIYGTGGAVSIVNASTITASNGNGVYLKSGGTVTNAGTISAAGTGHDAVLFSGSGADRVIVDPGAKFTGNIIGGGGSNTLELASAAGTGTISGLGTKYQNFGTVMVDSGAKWTLAGANTVAAGGTLTNNGTLTNTGTLEIGAAASVSGTVAFSGASSEIKIDGAQSPGVILSGATFANMVQGDTIDLAGIAYNATNSINLVGNQLQIVENGNSYDLNLSGIAGGEFLHLNSDGASGSDIIENNIPCFCRGTLILCEGGYVRPVERLKIGDKVRTLTGVEKPVVWIGSGRRILDGSNPNARPIIVRADALGEGVPLRDLYLTRGHSLYLDGVLIPVEYLINERSILWDDAATEIEYYHLELQDHDVILAEDAPAESYREDGNRFLFDNLERPRCAAANMTHYAPVLTGGPQVDRVWHALLARTGFLPPEATDDPDLHLLADGKRVEPDTIEDQRAGYQGRYRFRLDRAPARLLIASRDSVPMRMGLCHDRRRLGVAVRSIVLADAERSVSIACDSALLETGFNRPEPEARQCWTNGAALLPRACLTPFRDSLEVVLEIVCTTKYPLSAEKPVLLRAA